MKKEVLFALIDAIIQERINDLPRPKKGKAGKDFNLEEHREEITEILNSLIVGHRDGFKLKYSDLSLEDKEELKLKFQDLSLEDIKSLKGKKGKDGKDGKDGEDGKSFIWDEHSLKIETKIKSHIEDSKLKFEDLTEEEKSSLKLKFQDLNEEEISQLKGERGPRGQRGKQGLDGKDGRNGLDGKDGLNGKDGKDGLDGKDGPEGKQGERGIQGLSAFDLWSEENRGNYQDYLNSLKGEKGEQGDKGEQGERGPRGQRGKKGEQGEKGERGIQGAPGLTGSMGRSGRDGEAGKNAPVIVDIEIVQTSKDEFSLSFEFDNGQTIETGPVKLPSITQTLYSMTGSSGGGSSSITVSDGSTSLDTNTLNFTGATVVDNAGVAEITIDTQLSSFTDGVTSLDSNDICFDGATVSDNGGGQIKITIDQQSTNVTDGTTSLQVQDICFEGATVTDNGGGQAKVTIDTQDGGCVTISDEGNQITDCAKAMNFVGDCVEVTSSTVMADWNTLTEVDFIGSYEAVSPGNVTVTVSCGDTVPLTGTITPSQTLAVDTQVLSTWNSSDYILTLIAGTKRRQYNINAVNDEGTPVDMVKKVGSKIQADIDSNINGLNYELQVTNNELVNITYKLSKTIH